MHLHGRKLQLNKGRWGGALSLFVLGFIPAIAHADASGIEMDLAGIRAAEGRVQARLGDGKDPVLASCVHEKLFQVMAIEKSAEKRAGDAKGSDPSSESAQRIAVLIRAEAKKADEIAGEAAKCVGEGVSTSLSGSSSSSSLPAYVDETNAFVNNTTPGLEAPGGVAATPEVPVSAIH